jgi:hypothetical protein
MKVIFLFAALLVLAPALKSQADSVPELTFEDELFDFGTMNEGDTGIHTFWFVNTGKTSFFIKQAHPACGCTKPSHTKGWIASGDTGYVKVEFHSKGFGGQKVEKDVIIIYKSNAAFAETYARFRANILKPQGD